MRQFRPKRSPFDVPLDFESAKVRRTDPSTSKAAAKMVNVSSMRKAIIGFVKARGELGAATFEISEDMGLPRDYISPHMKWLVKNHFIYKNGKTRVNPNTRSKALSEIYCSFTDLPLSNQQLRTEMMRYSEQKKLKPLIQDIRELMPKIGFKGALEELIWRFKNGK